MYFKSTARGSVNGLVVRDEKMKGVKNNSRNFELSNWRSRIVVY